MKTLQEIISQTPVFLNDWDKKEQVIADFEHIYDFEENYEERINEITKDKYNNVNILFASYTYEDYAGNAFVLFEKEGKLFEVNGSHCSCFGLEDQFEPEEANLIELSKRLIEGSLGVENWEKENIFRSELKQFLGIS